MATGKCRGTAWRESKRTVMTTLRAFVCLVFILSWAGTFCDPAPVLFGCCPASCAGLGHGQRPQCRTTSHPVQSLPLTALPRVCTEAAPLGELQNVTAASAKPPAATAPQAAATSLATNKSAANKTIPAAAPTLHGFAYKGHGCCRFEGSAGRGGEGHETKSTEGVQGCLKLCAAEPKCSAVEHIPAAEGTAIVGNDCDCYLHTSGNPAKDFALLRWSF